MKPCLNKSTILKLIQEHKNLVVGHETMVKYHTDRVEVLNEYYRELTKPGFKSKNHRIIITQIPKEGCNIISSNTWST